MPTSPLQAYHPRWGWLCMFLGLYPIAFALKFLPSGDTTGYAPMWIMFLCGLAFVMAGTVILVKRHSPINILLVTLILLMLGTMGTGVSIFSPAEGFVGSFTALDEAQNVALARWMFGIGAVWAFMMSGYGIQQFLLSTIHPQARPAKGNSPGPIPPRPRSTSAKSASAKNVNAIPVRRRPRPGLLRKLLVPRSSVRAQYMQRNNGKPTSTPQRSPKSHKRVRPQANRAPLPPRQR